MEEKKELLKKETYDIFTIVMDLNQETKNCVMLTIGNYCLARFEDIEQCKEYVDAKPYELIVSLTTIITEKTINIINQLKEQKNGKETKSNLD